MSMDIQKIEHDKFLLNRPNELISLQKWQKTINLLAKLYNAPASFLVQYTHEGFQVTISSEQPSNPYPAGVIIKPETNIFCRKIVESRQPLYVPNALNDSYWDTNPEVHNDGFRSYYGVPVFWPNGEPFGTFCVMDYEVTDYNGPYLELIHQLKDLLESDLHLVEAFKEMQQLAVTDPLTMINNRRGFYTLAMQRIHLAKQAEDQLVLFYIDIDRFKSINDQYGHSAGDNVLRTVAEALKGAVRSSDIVGRLGGDEFAVLMTISSEQEITQFEQSLCQCDKNCTQSDLPEFSLTHGYIYVDCNKDFEQMLMEADNIMLEKKCRS